MTVTDQELLTKIKAQLRKTATFDDAATLVDALSAKQDMMEAGVAIDEVESDLGVVAIAEFIKAKNDPDGNDTKYQRMLLRLHAITQRKAAEDVVT